jgi:carbamoyl-phosphate synthase small subunit
VPRPSLADGTVFRHLDRRRRLARVGEVVFNTALTGYQEILTDPSYCRQIVTLTYPHIGNYGVNEEDVEASKVHAAGLIIKDLPLRAPTSAPPTLSQYLQREGTVAIAEHRHPRLTRVLRTTGAQNGCIVAFAARPRGHAGRHRSPMPVRKPRRRAQHGRPGPGPGGHVPGALRVDRDRVETGQRLRHARLGTEPALPCGGLRLRRQAQHPAHAGQPRLPVTVVPAQTPAAEVLALSPDGIFLSNGPGDPEPCDYAIAATRELIDTGMPTFGICLGHQILALASGAKTFKMKFGHHGANHPVKDLDSGRVSITSQNHGFAVDEKTLPANLRATHMSLFDGTLQGLARTDRPAFCFQGHPEASPGPHDIAYLFDRFTALMEDP